MSTDTTPASIGADAWMDPDTRDVINAERKQSWLDDYGIGGRAKAATYTVPLVRAALAGAAPAAQGDALTPEDADQLEKVIDDFNERGETDVPNTALQRYAAMGYLECSYYHVLPAARAAIDAARATKAGGAA